MYIAHIERDIYGTRREVIRVEFRKARGKGDTRQGVKSATIAVLVPPVKKDCSTIRGASLFVLSARV